MGSKGSDSSPVGYSLGGDTECEHPESEQEYLGNYSANAFYRCCRCDAVLVIPPRS